MTDFNEMDRGRPVLIVGGGGFLGSNLTRSLQEQGYSVINVSRSHLVRLEGAAVRYLTLDPADLAQLVARSSAVFHMAHGSSPASEISAMEGNLAASMNLTFLLARACADADVPLFYLSSGGAIYGADAPVPTPESAPTFPISAYGAEKLTAEHYLHIARRHLGLNYRVLRISNPFGPWQLGRHGQGVIGTWMRRILAEECIDIWGDGSVRRDYIFVDDVSEAMRSLMCYDGAVRTFNIGSGRGYSLNEIIEQLRELTGSSLRIRYRDAAPSHVPVSILDSGLAERELGWRAETDLAEGLRLSWAWMQRHIRAGRVLNVAES